MIFEYLWKAKNVVITTPRLAELLDATTHIGYQASLELLDTYTLGDKIRFCGITWHNIGSTDNVQMECMQ